MSVPGKIQYRYGNIKGDKKASFCINAHMRIASSHDTISCVLPSSFLYILYCMLYERGVVLLSKLDIIYIKNSKIDSFNNNRSYVKWSILKKSIIFKVPEGVQHFSGGGGVQLFPERGGTNCLFPIETHITCDFPGGSGPPVHPLDPYLRY